MRKFVFIAAAAALAACTADSHHLPPLGRDVHRTISVAGWDSLPLLPASDGSLVCLADGQSACPINGAVANWLADGQFATWENGRLVHAWKGRGDPIAIGDIGPAENQYSAVAAVGSQGTGYVVLGANGEGMFAFEYDRVGKQIGHHPIPPVRPTFATGYSGRLPFLQEIVPGENGSLSHFVVKEIDSPGDTIGHVVLTQPLPWLRVTAGKVAPVPLFSTLPSYSLTADSDVVWSPGATRSVERDAADGHVRWQLSTSATGDSIRPAEFDSMRPPVTADAAVRMRFDSVVAVSGPYHPAVTAVLVSPDERVLVQPFLDPARDSISYYTLARDGTPGGRIRLPRRSRVILFGGDSVLVQRSGANMHAELRWLRLGTGGRPR